MSAMAHRSVTLEKYLQRFVLPAPDSHKGQNGKLLIIGGSELFHAASKWSLDTAAQFVDMVFYASVPSTNELVKQAKGQFWNGIVISRTDIANYIAEADVVLIGPGMERQEALSEPRLADFEREPTEEEWNTDTELVVNHLLQKYPDKRWVLDAGALQMLRPKFLPKGAILTPHQGELTRLLQALPEFSGLSTEDLLESDETLRLVASRLNDAVLLIKGKSDVVVGPHFVERIGGGNAGMTKGGTGDVLAGLVAALACTQESDVAVVVGSLTNTLAGEALYEQQGVFFGASQLVQEVPKVLWGLVQSEEKKG